MELAGVLRNDDRLRELVRPPSPVPSRGRLLRFTVFVLWDRSRGGAAAAANAFGGLQPRRQLLLRSLYAPVSAQFMTFCP
jgi:hypothetical protein